ncbi:uncharacterized protein LOC111699602 isoform X2 [Eurytemora carolleeae]|uniref:uncharacterized protein LOC111699602 isoform X2 n=1 Tax=Eurytemora carolleeae TaxID=1294199 RepID=UPI000C76D425|nr:uncharacterized protein LOC111699602 isoform X2 [Eurytemora carolleeae]|eukprot:XP_023326079.1 uncharacterized protein LOC111699602 isoform X2 [Eurytemora affinis]
MKLICLVLLIASANSFISVRNMNYMDKFEHDPKEMRDLYHIPYQGRTRYGNSLRTGKPVWGKAARNNNRLAIVRKLRSDLEANQDQQLIDRVLQKLSLVL